MEEEIDSKVLVSIIDAALLAAGEPLSIERMIKLFGPGELGSSNSREKIREALASLTESAVDRGYILKRVATGYRYQVRQDLSPWISRLWDEKPPRYSRALLETLALIVYKQPVTRGDIEQIRGVSVSPNIMRTLLERDWIRVVGQREVPGRPSMYGTTKAFLDYFDLKNLNELPPLPELKQLLEPLVQAGEGTQNPDEKQFSEIIPSEIDPISPESDPILAEVVELPVPTKSEDDPD